MADMKVSLVLRAVDKLSAPLRRIVGGVRNAGAAASDAQRRLDEVGRTRVAIDGFRRLKTQTSETAQRLQEAERRVAAIAREMRAAGEPTATLTRRFEAARREAARLQQAHQDLVRQTEGARRALHEAGVSTRDLARHQRDLTREAQAAEEALRREEERLQKVERAQQRMAEAQERLGHTMQLAGHMSMVSGTATGVGQQAMGYVTDVLDSVREVERRRGELASVGVENLDLIVDRGREMQGRLAGVTAATFVAAAYDIKSGISSLSDEGVAAMTAAAAVTAKATRASTEQVSSLFATAYGIFKGQFQEMADGAFGEMFASSLAASVKLFKTSGSEMQQAIESAGSGATNLGMRMTEQLAVLGMLQQKMQAGEAGTAVAAFARAAGRAQAQFDTLAGATDNPVRVRVLDADGMLRQMPDILADLQARYGDTLDAMEATEIGGAFGSDEAVKIIQGLWGQHDAMRANTAALDEAGAAGLEFATAMAKAVDNNLDARLALAAQRADLFKQTVGDALMPTIDKLLPVFDRILVKLEGWIERNPELAVALGGAAVGTAVLGVAIGGLFAILSTVIGGFGLFRFAVAAATGRLAILRAGSVAASGSTGLLGRTMAGLGGGLRKGAGMMMGLSRSALGLAGRALPAVVTGVRAVAMALMTNPIGLIVGGIALAAGLIIANWGAVGPWFGRMWEAIKGVFARGWEAVKGLVVGGIALAVDLIIANWGNVGPWFGRMWEAVKGVFARGWEAIKGLLSWTPLGLIATHWDAVGPWFGRMWEAVKGVFARGWEAVKGLLSWTPLGLIIAQWEPVTGFFDRLFGGIKQTVAMAIDWIGEKLRPVVEWAQALTAPLQGVVGWVGDKLGMGTADRPAEMVDRSDRAVGGIRGIGVTAGAAAEAGVTRPAVAEWPDEHRVAPVTITNTFHIQAAPDQDPREIAEAVAKILERQQRRALYD